MVDRAIGGERRRRERPRTSRAVIAQDRIALILIASWVSSADLVIKTVDPTRAGLFHKRTYYELALIMAISAAVAYLVPLARSRITTIGAGLMVGGGFGNGLSIAIFPLGVPNPFTVSYGGWTIAFNLADIGVVTGFVLMTIGVCRLVSERKGELREPVER